MSLLQSPSWRVSSMTYVLRLKGSGRSGRPWHRNLGASELLPKDSGSPKKTGSWVSFQASERTLLTGVLMTPRHKRSYSSGLFDFFSLEAAGSYG